MKTRTRFAPSPTGYMHIGNLRTALYEYLIAKSQGGDFILRIEDTDQKRYVEGATDIIYATLKTVGMNWDEGPDIGGNFGPYVQSERKALYAEYAHKLVELGGAHYCFCSQNEADEQKNEEENIKFQDPCKLIPLEEAKKRVAAGEPYVIRQTVNKKGTSVFHDVVYGEIEIDYDELDEGVLLKSDGFPTYNFANVVDDHLMGITHVVRGNEYLSSSPKYNRLYEAFGWEVPVYVHCPLITDEEHHKLSKRCGHSSYEDLIDQGFLTEAIVNFVSLLGWSPSDSNEEIFSLQDLVKNFDYHHMSKSPAVFDYTKLKWMNGEYIKAMDDVLFFEKAEPYIKQAVTRKIDLHKLADMVKTRIEIFPDIPELIDFFEKLPAYDPAMYEHKKMKTTKETSLEVLKALMPLLKDQEDYSNDALYKLLTDFAQEKGVKNGYVLWPVRTAVSGKQMTPAGATEIMELLGKEETIARIEEGISLLENAQ